MKQRTKFILYCLLATFGLPAGFLLLNYQHIGYIRDTGHETLTLAELQAGKHPSTIHLTITHAVIDERGGVEHTRRSKKSTTETHFSALQSTDNPGGPAPVVIVSESNPIFNKSHTFSGIWTNGDTGMNAQIAEMLKEQGIALTDKPLILNLDESRDASVTMLGLWTTGAFLLPLLVLGMGLLMMGGTKDPALEEQRLEASKQLLAPQIAALQDQLAASLGGHFPGVEPGEVSAIGSFSVGTNVSVTVAGETYPAPNDVHNTILGFHKLLKQHKVPFSYISFAWGEVKYY